jgi:hypothetical protein
VAAGPAGGSDATNTPMRISGANAGEATQLLLKAQRPGGSQSSDEVLATKTHRSKDEALYLCRDKHRELLICFADRSALSLNPCGQERDLFWKCFEKELGRDANLSTGLRAVDKVGNALLERIRDDGSKAR